NRRASLVPSPWRLTRPKSACFARFRCPLARSGSSPETDAARRSPDRDSPGAAPTPGWAIMIGKGDTQTMARIVRWVIAGAAVVALVYAMLPTLPGSTEMLEPGAAEASDGACPANAKKADLNFTVKDLEGRSVKLADFKGKVILLDFWATWCPPCKAEIPGFVELQEQYGEQGLQVVGVSVDDPPEKLKPFA